MGLEISEVINNFMNKEKNLNIPKDKDGFFKYLNTALSNERAGSYREFDEDKTIRITKEVKTKLKKSREYIIGEERQLGRKLTYDERIKGISEWFKEQEYVDLLNVINVGRISYASNDEDNEIDTLNFFYTHPYDSPLDEYIKKTNMETILETVKSLLNKKQERARDCDRALFTLYCIKNDIKGLYPVLDQEIIDSFHKDGKEPKQYVIYLKYHPKVQKSSAEAMAAKNLGEFLKEIKTSLKEIN